MILVVADTGPIHYLILIDATAVLPRLYDRVVLPNAVFNELSHPRAPAAVKKWMRNCPSYIEVRDGTFGELDPTLGPGEAEAILLAQQLKADGLLLDESEARHEAMRLGLPVTGTVGILEKAAQRGLIDLAEAFEKLTRTSFRIAPELLQDALERDAARRKGRDSG